MSIPLTIDQSLPDLSGKIMALIGDLSTRRNQIVKQFILDGFQNEGSTCVVTLTISANELIDELSQYSPEASMIVNDAILNERLQIVDMYSFRGMDTSEDIPGTHILPAANDLTVLSITLNKILQTHPKCRVTIWPFSLLAIYTQHSDLINFTQTLAARLSSRNQAGLLVMNRGVVRDEERVSLESIVDSVLETKRVEEDGAIEEYFRVKFFRGSDENEYELWTPMS